MFSLAVSSHAKTVLDFRPLPWKCAKTSPVLVFIRDRTNSEPCRSKTRPAFIWFQTSTLCRSRTSPVSSVPCERNAVLCQNWTSPKSDRSRVNGVLVTVYREFVTVDSYTLFLTKRPRNHNLKSGTCPYSQYRGILLPVPRVMMLLKR